VNGTLAKEARWQQRAVRACETLEALIARGCRWVIFVTSFTLLVLLFGNVVLRYLFHTDIVWAVELPENLLFPWLVMAGVVLAAQHGAHIAVDLLVHMLTPNWQRGLLVFINLLVFAAYAVLTQQAAEVADIVSTERSPILQLPAIYSYASLVVGFGLLALISLLIAVKVAIAGAQAAPHAEPEEAVT
jgi:TRAP-type transport system small permease protein